jgi:glycosyltransferase involved in cell wall biosynthesis
MSTSGKKIVVVIPAYKAKDTLPVVIQRIPAAVYAGLHRIVVVEDAGTDVPRSTTPALVAQFPKIEVLLHEQNKGYGAAQKTGYRRALELGADVAVLLHADGQYAPEIMADLYAPLVRGEADVVLGSRMHQWGAALRGGMPLYKWVANIGLTRLENLAYGMRLSEYHSGYMLYTRKALDTIPFDELSDTFHFDGEMLLMAGKCQLRIADLPIPTHYGDEESHLDPIRYGFEVLGVVLKNLRGEYDRLLTPAGHRDGDTKGAKDGRGERRAQGP